MRLVVVYKKHMSAYWAIKAYVCVEFQTRMFEILGEIAAGVCVGNMEVMRLVIGQSWIVIQLLCPEVFSQLLTFK